MMNIPFDPGLPIQKLSGVFNNTTNSYKFYWFLAILNKVKKSNKSSFKIDDLVIEMIGEIWYPINYFKLNFGKSDQFSNGITQLKSEFNIESNIDKKVLFKILQSNKEKPIVKQLLNNFSRYVPFRFLTPWFEKELRGIPDHQKKTIISESSMASPFHPPNYCPYAIAEGTITLHPQWRSYFYVHLSILQKFVFWGLVTYLQKNNPNVPGLTEKIFPPMLRKLTNANFFWKEVAKVDGDLFCIYSNKEMSLENFSIDHFIPWSFVTHDQLWNLIPTTKSINSSKGNNFPSLTDYLDPFVEIQHKAFKVFLENNQNNKKLLYDYTTIFKKDLEGIARLNSEEFGEILKENINPLYQIGENMGFSTDWKL